MSRESRWYGLIRFTLIGGLFVVLVVLWSVIARQASVMGASASDCGCTVAPVRWPLGIVVGTIASSLVAFVITVRFLAAILIRLWRHHQVAKALLMSGRRLWHHSAKVWYVLREGEEEQAMTVGLLRPTIVVTTGLVHRLSGTELTSVLRHEEAHARRRDPLWSLLLEAVGSTFGWRLGLRAIVNSAFSLRELLADAAATKNYTRVAGLSGAISKLATTESPLVLPAFSPNNDRINMLLDRAWQLPLPRLTWRIGFFAFGLSLGLFLAGQLPTATAAAQPQLPAEACWLKQTMCESRPTTRTIFMSPTSVMSRYGW